MNKSHTYLWVCGCCTRRTESDDGIIALESATMIANCRMIGKTIKASGRTETEAIRKYEAEFRAWRKDRTGPN